MKALLAFVLLATSSFVAAGPCDIYASGGTPCVAAHSTTRALFSSFTGSLYQVKRASDSKTTNIAPLSAGGVANAATQDSFCSGTTCVITTIFDQTGRGNHLTQAPPGSAGSGPAANGFDNLASATGAPVTLNGQKAYGVFIPPGTGYRNNAPSGTATGDKPQGMYAIFDGTHFNGGCCFDYGNAETNSRDNGAGHMEAIYFGNINVWGTGSGSGPWIMADMENGLFSGVNVHLNSGDPTISDRFLTAVVKGEAGHWSIRGGNAQSGALSTFYDGARPNASGYNPMSKEGAIILGIGGDNSHGAQGTFYEGVMTSGYPSASTEDAVQANIVAAKYATTTLNGAPLSVGSQITLRTSTTQFLAHSGPTVNTQVVSPSSNASLQRQATWTVRSALATNTDCFSFESVDTPGSFLRQSNFQLRLDANDKSKSFAEDATFCTHNALNGQGHAIQSWSNPTRFFRQVGNQLYIASNDDVNKFDSADAFNEEASWVIGAGFA